MSTDRSAAGGADEGGGGGGGIEGGGGGGGGGGDCSGSTDSAKPAPVTEPERERTVGTNTGDTIPCGDACPDTDTLILRDFDAASGVDVTVVVDVDVEVQNELVDLMLVVVDVGLEPVVLLTGVTPAPAAARSVAIRRNETCGDGWIWGATRGESRALGLGDSKPRAGDGEADMLSCVLTDMR